MTRQPEPSPLDQLSALMESAQTEMPASNAAIARVSKPLGSVGGDLFAASVTGIISLVKTISYAALIFSAGLSPYLPTGLGLLFISNLVIRVITSLTSSFPPAIYNPQTEQIVVIAFMATAIADSLPPDTSREALLATLIGSIALSSMLTGLTMGILGVLRKGDLGRYLPYPIMGGFLSGISWLMITGAFRLIAGTSLTLVHLPDLFSSGRFLQLLAGIALAGTLLFFTRRIQQPWVMPVVFLSIVGLFYGIATVVGFSAVDIREQGWLLDISAQKSLWQPLNLESLKQIDWMVIQNQFTAICTLALLSILSWLLSATNLEIALGKDIDLNQELKSLGFANFTSGLCGGTVGTLSLSSNLLAYKLGGRTRLVGLTGGVLYGVALLYGMSFITILPRFALGGVLLFLGTDLLTKWFYTAWSKLPKSEYLVALFVFGAIAFTGLITGVGIGLLLAIGLFVVNYSRISPSRYTLLGGSYKSNVIRPTNQQVFLSKQGNQIYIIELEGYLFFGTANTLLTQVAQAIQATKELLPIRYIILDFRLVRGVDFSATLSFDKLKSMASKEGITLLYTSLSPVVLKTLRQAGILEVKDSNLKVFEDIDRGFEWCEESILEQAHWRRQRFFPLAMQLSELFKAEADVSLFFSYLEKLQFSAGETIIEQGDFEKGLFFVEVGQVSAIITLQDHSTKRLQTFTAGTICGKRSLYSDRPRTSTLQAEQDCQLYCLSKESFAKMGKNDPHLVNTLLQFILESQNIQIESYEKELKSLLS